MDEKIVITEEECDKVLPEQPFAARSPCDVQDTPARGSRGKSIVLSGILAIFVFVVVGMVAYCLVKSDSPGRDGPVGQIRTIDQYREECIAWINTQLSGGDDAICKYVEGAHLTVKATSAYVMNCNVKTVDGTNLAGEDDSNIQEVALTIRVFWDGEVHKGGHTDLMLTIDKRAGRVLDAKIIDTNALVNVADPKFWYGLGALLLL